MDHRRTPLFTALIEYASRNLAALGILGHKALFALQRTSDEIMMICRYVD
ncbi:hypothetical protein [Aneurinibacillus migulanus]|nr:hypothetical protein [Aneurinibacillus migulanus]